MILPAQPTIENKMENIFKCRKRNRFNYSFFKTILVKKYLCHLFIFRRVVEEKYFRRFQFVALVVDVVFVLAVVGNQEVDSANQGLDFVELVELHRQLDIEVRLELVSATWEEKEMFFEV